MTIRSVEGAQNHLLAYFDAIYWAQVEAGVLPRTTNPDAPFRRPGFWAKKNPSGYTSRDRHTDLEMAKECCALEDQLAKLGCSLNWFSAVHNRIRPLSLWAYRARVLKRMRTLIASNLQTP